MKYVKGFLIKVVMLLYISLLQATPTYFFIEGATGVGKTTFVSLLQKKLPNISVIYEPLESFIDVNGAGNVLELFFTDPQRWNFAVNVYITLMHFKAAQAVSPESTIVFIDRSMHADCYVYGKMAYKAGTLTGIEWAIYQEFFNWLIKSNAIQPSGFIYLKAPAGVVLERVYQRNRIEENKLPLEYQIQQEQCYNEWFIEQKDISNDIANVPVLIIDAHQNFKDNSGVQQQCIQNIKDFIAMCIKNS